MLRPDFSYTFTWLDLIVVFPAAGGSGLARAAGEGVCLGAVFELVADSGAVFAGGFLWAVDGDLGLAGALAGGVAGFAAAFGWAVGGGAFVAGLGLAAAAVVGFVPVFECVAGGVGGFLAGF